jgi:hypothetical protein
MNDLEKTIEDMTVKNAFARHYLEQINREIARLRDLLECVSARDHASLFYIERVWHHGKQSDRYVPVAVYMEQDHFPFINLYEKTLDQFKKDTTEDNLKNKDIDLWLYSHRQKERANRHLEVLKHQSTTLYGLAHKIGGSHEKEHGHISRGAV